MSTAFSFNLQSLNWPNEAQDFPPLVVEIFQDQALFFQKILAL
jgi:hypothetical protein